ncbi:protein TASOR-like [Megalops cyprinoides]|uniref:protein TASOR-like n=1 Tax=Megalops cyprinoides TaxID=118141 RepID=UPI0018650B6A|nr:protein TASOR-like [Megalops cyprinoides]
METRSGRKTMELPSQNSSHSTTSSSLKNFTIPRKKREAGKGSIFFEPCPKENREFSCIQSTLSESRLDMGKEVFLSWQSQDVRLVHNEKLLREFSDKRSEMRSKGRHGREMEERFCFLVTSEQAKASICQNGLKTESTAQHSLGNPSHGVYLYRHVDVALRNAMRNSATPKNIIIFKVILGKVKKLQCSLGKSSIQDPTIQFDSYVSKDTVDPKDPLSQQILGSSVFIFDYNENQELLPRPRQCLPYAVVLAVPISNTSSLATSYTPVPSSGMTPGIVCLNWSCPTHE